MQIINTTPTQGYDICRAVSENQRWEIGMRRSATFSGEASPEKLALLCGVRICGGIVDSNFYTFDYCAGADYYFAVTLLAIVKEILKHLPEKITEKDLQLIFPKEGARPNTINSQCTQELLKLVEKLNSQPTRIK
jgi:hypothetical protein